MQWPQLYSTRHLWSKEEMVLLLSQHLGPPLSTLGIPESETKDLSFKLREKHSYHIYKHPVSLLSCPPSASSSLAKAAMSPLLAAATAPLSSPKAWHTGPSWPDCSPSSGGGGRGCLAWPYGRRISCAAPAGRALGRLREGREVRSTLAFAAFWPKKS